ncbi:MAG TPA: Wzz/FepE/Etk N-terminal domain-containing protein [Conexibacter sp.]|nr:Wzz/FepE/Etk N-terminal domain-containing protein [Conexibacter sp.]
MNEQAADTYLPHLVGALRRRWPIVLACVLIVPAVAVALALSKQKQYAAQAQILFSQPHFDQTLFGSSAPPAQDPTRDAATNLKLVDLRAVSVLTGRALALPTEQVSGAVAVAAEGDANLASVTATWGTPRFAAKLADTYVQQYVAFRRRAERAQLRSARLVVEGQLAQLTPEQQASPDGQMLQNRANQLQILAALQTGDAELVSPAGVPGSPSSPRPKRDAALGLVLGLLLGIGLALLRDRFDARMRSVDEVRRALRAPVFGSLPLNRRIRGGGAPDARTADVFRAIHANLRYDRVEHGMHVLMLTSLDSGDGRGAVATQLATAAADGGSRVLLIRADLRSPSAGPGLTSVLVDGAAVHEVVHRTDTSSGLLDVLEPGPEAGSPMSLLSSPRMSELLEQARLSHDLVLVDVPPLGSVPDGIPLARSVDGALVVVRMRSHAARELASLRSELDHLGVRAVGALVTGARPSAQRYESLDLSPSLEPH